ncbi:excinuclease ABC subunit UvrC [Thermosipho atlanticus]|uniref:UvrABC system protein C n=1 Tax=Thermosipho atlanticus DSM 15807 TaxID=1123380 RepID=A0A1M5STC0_9BACT|nr:excinuclease ABC subunit UvrC [Thermosipho atlanticus]SHH41488.1 Excinuclease ABC subunit C [Thermosipho atlanticus DSM 15807]
MLEKKLIEKVSNKPGVYLFKRNKEYIYIGKAKNLKKRLASHFNLKEEKSKLIINEATSLETIIVTNEKEALLLEATLINKYQPKYNVMLKGNEFYPYIRISNDKFPYIEVVRSRKKDGIYFGPYTNIRFTKVLVEILQKILKFRTCKKELSKIKKPCILFHLNTCTAPCIENIDKKSYQTSISKLYSILKGDFDFVRNFIRDKMEHHAKMLDFENAIKYRDLLYSFEKLLNSQGVILSDKRNVDYIAFDHNIFVILKVRGGVLISKLIYEGDFDIEEFLYHFYYGISSERPDRIVIDNKLSFDFDITISTPIDSDDEGLLKIAYENLLDKIYNNAFDIETLKELKELLKLKKIPKLIEGTDISHRSGKYTVASLIVFENGKPRKDLYRKYKLGNILDDFKSIKLLIKKRYTKHKLPDLFFVDGGRGQVNAALEAFKELGFSPVVVGLAKENEIIITKEKEFVLPFEHPILRMFVKIRDETHRVANAFSNNLYLKNYRTKILDEIPGIGPKRKKLLLKNYGSIENIKNAPLEELEKLIGKKLAKRLKEEL